MRGREDVPGFIRAFAGDNRYIVDYLVEEVLQRQPERVRSFLLQTSILDRLSGPLCDAVTDQEEGNVVLETLERGNFFVVPLDDKRHWYRYHHLFADVLHAHLMAGAARSGTYPASARERVVRAEWFGGRCDPPRAGRRGFRAGGGPGRAGSASNAPEQTGGHVAWLAQGAPRRADPAAGPCSALRYAGTLLARRRARGR